MLNHVIFEVDGPMVPEMTPVDDENIKLPPRVDKEGDIV